MAHEIETMAYVNEVPWHGLGAEIAPNSTPDEMLNAAKLNWKIIRKPIYWQEDDGSMHGVKGRSAFIRDTDRKVMSVAGNDWHPWQNRDLLQFFKDYVEAGGASLETAGSLRGGKIVWALANLHDGFEVSPGDHVKGYLLCTASHSMGTANTIRATTVRVVCRNTMALAESQGSLIYRQTHWGEFDTNAAKESVELAHESLARAAKRAATLKQFKVGYEDRLDILARFFDGEVLEMMDELYDPSKWGKKLAEVMFSIDHAPGADPETGWGILNGVTHWADHVNGRNAATRMFRSWIGDVGKLKLDVEEKLLELAE